MTKSRFLLGLSALALGASLLSSPQAHAAVWTETNQWNEQWEQKYSDWVNQKVTTDMFTNINSPYFGIATDCADFTYMVRAIFSMENSLPFALNTFWDSKYTERISNKTKKFDKVKDLVTEAYTRNENKEVVKMTLPRALENGKMRAFLVELGDKVGTWTMPYDTYPIAIDKNNLRGGTVFLRQGYNHMSLMESIVAFLTGTPPNPEEGPGHALLVKSVLPSGAVELIQSTLPKKVRDLSIIYEIELLPTNKSLGFRRFIQPQFVGKKLSDLPGYSDEQFTEIGRVENTNTCSPGGAMLAPSSCSTPNTKSTRRNITQFRKDVMKKVGVREETADELKQRKVKTLCGAVHQRADVIRTTEIFKLAKLSNGECMDSGSYENYSTPSRDEQIRRFIDDISLSDKKTRELLDACGSVKIDSSNKEYKIFDLVDDFDSVSSDPNESTAARWGMASPKKRCKYDESKR